MLFIRVVEERALVSEDPNKSSWQPAITSLEGKESQPDNDASRPKTTSLRQFPKKLLFGSGWFSLFVWVAILCTLGSVINGDRSDDNDEEEQLVAEESEPTNAPTEVPTTTTQESPTPTTEPTATPQPLTEEESIAAIIEGTLDNDLQSVDVFDQRINIEFTMPFAFRTEGVIFAANFNAAQIAGNLVEAGYTDRSIFFQGYDTLIDVYGNESVENVYKLELSTDTLSRTNWPNFNSDNFPLTADSYWHHPAYDQ